MGYVILQMNTGHGSDLWKGIYYPRIHQYMTLDTEGIMVGLVAMTQSDLWHGQVDWSHEETAAWHDGGFHESQKTQHAKEFMTQGSMGARSSAQTDTNVTSFRIHDTQANRLQIWHMQLLAIMRWFGCYDTVQQLLENDTNIQIQYDTYMTHEVVGGTY